MPAPLFIFTQPPIANAPAREGIEALLACAAFDQQPAIMFIDQGVLQLLPQGEQRGAKNLNKMLQALELYGVESVYVCLTSLNRLGLTAADIQPSGQLIEPRERAAIIQAAAWVASF
ncbi:MAG TPA: sulfurtransferase complex subunit TusC [Cellvibrionaceae bacterium]|nr:sulfurtransferase complex subunit TusC [Cellvibrionaceae bacterium]HMW71454.1 sulfurtransferase complex subunit TusC [Cellvibrionaceae bacterium]HMY40212.1 sulfurtransferase complex subunit TusC [Marinagarivorans sp.]